MINNRSASCPLTRPVHLALLFLLSVSSIAGSRFALATNNIANNIQTSAKSASPSQQSDEEPKGITLIENPLSWSNARFVPFEVGLGATTELNVSLRLPEHYHAYVERFRLHILSPDKMRTDKPRLSPIIQFFDSVSKSIKDGIENDSELRVTVEVPNHLSPGEHEVEFEITYQACTSEFCMLPIAMPAKAKLKVLATPSSSPQALDSKASTANTRTDIESDKNAKLSNASSQSEDGFAVAMKKGVLFAFLFVFLGGILTSLTPCVYPMIPITLAVIGARTKGQTKLKSFCLSLTYVLGIAVTYSLLGVGAASTGAMFGSALANIYVVTVIALLFVLMGLSMYGLFEIQAPAFIRDRLGSQQVGSGFGGAFLTGLISGIVASPCIGPVLVTILTWIAQTGNKALGFGLLFTFAMGMGILLILLGTFSHMLNKIPKGGAWMEAVKFTFGTAMVAMALYYIQPLYPTWLYHGLVALALIMIASAYGAFASPADLSPLGRLRKGLMLALFFVGLMFCLVAVADRADLKIFSRAAVTSPTGEENATQTPQPKWQPYSEAMIEEAAKSHKAVLIDFFAEWCAACKELEHTTFPDSRVQAFGDNYVFLKIDATEDSPELQRLKKKYSVVGLPTLIIYDVSGKRRDDLTLTGFEEPEPFAARLQRAL